MMKRETMKAEAIERMKLLDIFPQAIKDFEERDVLNESEGDFGSLYWLDDDEKKLVNEYEKRTGYLVYHVIHSLTNIGELYSLLYVSPFREDWKYEKAEMKQDGLIYLTAYVHNKSMPDCSEAGSISARRVFGGLVRIY